MLVERGVVVICGGGGGIPVVQREAGELVGVEAIIDKDRASSLLARQLGADMLLLLTYRRCLSRFRHSTGAANKARRCGGADGRSICAWLHGPEGRGGDALRRRDRPLGATRPPSAGWRTPPRSSAARPAQELKPGVPNWKSVNRRATGGSIDVGI